MSESNRRRLFELLKTPGNNICADCDQEGISYSKFPQISLYSIKVSSTGSDILTFQYFDRSRMGFYYSRSLSMHTMCEVCAFQLMQN